MWQHGTVFFFSQRNLHGTPLKEQSTCLCHFSCTRLQFNAIFHILQMVTEMFCSALNEPREGTRAVKSDFCPHVIPRTSRDAALLGHSSGGLLLQQLRLSTWGGCFLLFGSLKKNWPVGAVGRQRHFREMGLNETSTVGTALQVPFIIIWQVLGVLVPWRFVSSPEIPTCHWKLPISQVLGFDTLWVPMEVFPHDPSAFFRGYRDSPLSIGFSTFLSPSTRESTTRKATSTCDDGPSFGLMPPGSSCAYATMIYNVYTL